MSNNIKKHILLKTLVFAVMLMLVASISMGCGSNDGGDKSGNNAQGEETKKEPVSIFAKDARLREAIALAIDKEALVKSQEINNAMAINYIVPKGLTHLDGGEDFRDVAPTGYRSFDLAKAQALWDEATEETTLLTLKLLTFDAPQSLAIAQGVKEQLEGALKGLTVEIDALPYEEKVAKEQAGEFDLDFSGWNPDYADAMSYLEIWSAEHVMNTSLYASEAYNQHMEKVVSSEKSLNNAQRIQSMQQAEAVLIQEDTAAIPIYQRVKRYLVKPAVKGILFLPYGPSYSLLNADTQTLVEGVKQLRIMTMQELTTLDTTKANTSHDLTVLANTMEGLVRHGDQNKILPGVATSWQVSKDGLTYTFKLRPEALWSTGEAVKAQDFVFAWQKLSGQKLSGQKIKIVEAKAIDDFTLQVKLEKPAPYFLEALCQPAYYPQQTAFAERLGATYGTNPEAVLYNGPFTVSRWEPGLGVTLMANPKYWNKSQVALEQVQYRNIPDNDVAVELYDGLQLDVAILGGEKARAYQGHAEFVQAEESTVYYFTFNFK